MSTLVIGNIIFLLSTLVIGINLHRKYRIRKNKYTFIVYLFFCLVGFIVSINYYVNKIKNLILDILMAKAIYKMTI